MWYYRIGYGALWSDSTAERTLPVRPSHMRLSPDSSLQVGQTWCDAQSNQCVWQWAYMCCTIGSARQGGFVHKCKWNIDSLVTFIMQLPLSSVELGGHTVIYGCPAVVRAVVAGRFLLCIKNESGFVNDALLQRQCTTTSHVKPQAARSKGTASLKTNNWKIVLLLWLFFNKRTKNLFLRLMEAVCWLHPSNKCCPSGLSSCSWETNI